MKLKEIVKLYKSKCERKVDIIGNDDIEVEGLNLCNRITTYNQIMSYATEKKYVEDIKNNKQIVVLIIKECDKEYFIKDIKERNGAILCSSIPEYTFYEIHEMLYAETNFYKKYKLEKIIGRNCRISDSAYIEPGVEIGNNVVIGHNTTIRHGSIIEDNVSIGCNTVIGSEGFQAICEEGLPTINVTHVGGCYISEGTHIGDGNTVCNSLFEGYSYIGKNVKTDNLVHIAHNSFIEDDVVLTAGVILCGTVTIRKGAWIAPNTSILNKVEIGEYARTGLGSVVIKNVPSRKLVYGSPATERVNDGAN